MSYRVWWRVLAGMAVVMLGGGMLLLVLALGFANPPRAGGLRWETDSVAGWRVISGDGTHFMNYASPVPLPPPPFTLEVTARNDGLPDSEWGIWTQLAGAERWAARVSKDGYLTVYNQGAESTSPFIHIRPDVNTLYLHVQRDRTATLRVNGEIAWTGSLAFGGESAWGVSELYDPMPTWERLQIFAP